MEPTAATPAMETPETAPKTAEAPTVAIASPPRSHCSQTTAAWKRFLPTGVAARKLPISTKSGSASNSKLLSWPNSEVGPKKKAIDPRAM